MSFLSDCRPAGRPVDELRSNRSDESDGAVFSWLICGESPSSERSEENSGVGKFPLQISHKNDPAHGQERPGIEEKMSQPL